VESRFRDLGIEDSEGSEQGTDEVSPEVGDSDQSKRVANVLLLYLLFY
jgi:hypothetical protein